MLIKDNFNDSFKIQKKSLISDEYIAVLLIGALKEVFLQWGRNEFKCQITGVYEGILNIENQIILTLYFLKKSIKNCFILLINYRILYKSVKFV